VPVLFAEEEWWQRNWDESMTHGGPLSVSRLWRVACRLPYRWRNRRLIKQFGQRGHILAISDSERAYFTRWAPAAAVSVIPLGVDSAYYAPQNVVEDFDIGMFGAFADERNYRPAREFFDTLVALPAGGNLRWVFVGRDPHPMIRSLASPNVMVTGSVPETRPYYARVRVVVAPARAGAGAKTTVMKACSMGKSVVATSFCLGGIPLQHGRHLIRTDSLDEMAKGVIWLLANAGARQAMGHAARAAIQQTCDDSLRAVEVVSLCNRLIFGSGQQLSSGR
jgi:glycosyltransferase involved in cell wall biosynthesis